MGNFALIKTKNREYEIRIDKNRGGGGVKSWKSTSLPAGRILQQ